MTHMGKTRPPTDGQAGLLRAIHALGKMFALIGPDLKIRSSSTNTALSPDRNTVGKYCYDVFFQRSSPCGNCGMETALKQGRAVVTPRRDTAPAPRGLLHNYIYPLYENDIVDSLVCVGLELPVQPPPVKRSDLSKSFLFNLIDSAVDGVVAADKQGKIRVFNDTAATVSGYKAEEALAGLNIRALYTNGGAYEVMKKLRSPDYGGAGKLLGYQTVVVGKNGDTIPVRINASIIYEGDREIATIGFIHDMREELRLKKAVDDFSHRKTGAGAQNSLGNFITGLTRQLAVYDMKFCSAVIDGQMATPGQVESALKQQQKALEKTKVHVPIGRVMIQLGIITEAQRQALLDQADGTKASETDAKVEKTPAVADRVDEDPGIRVSEDKLTAFFPPGTQGPRSLPLDGILKMATGMGIRYGLLDAPAIEKQIVADPQARHRLVIARGKDPVPAIPPHARLFFETDPLRIGTVREDGTTDWKDRGELPHVKQGDRLAEIMPGKEGFPGLDIFGEAIAPPEPAATVPDCGKGAVLSEDGRHITAGQDGMVTLSLGGALTVEQAMRIEGDIGLETGHINFEGHIEVTGSIQKGYRVRGHSLRAKEILGAEVHMAGDMFVTDGIYESDIKCKDTLKVGHIHKSTITTGAGIIVEREIIESGIETAGRCTIGDGNIMASEISATKGIAAKNIGTEASRPNTLVVGVDHRRAREAKTLKNKLSVLKKEKKRLASELETAQRREEEVSRALGDAAQLQDRQMVKIRDIEAQQKDPSVTRDQKKLGRVGKKLKYLLSKQEAQDAAVESLMAQDEAISAKRAALASDLEHTDQGLDRLTAEMEALGAASETDQGIPLVKVAGTLAARTVINGPKTSLTIREEQQRVQVMETDRPDAEGRRKLRMGIMTLK
jgi:uncharacterized protein